jgi:hypothetical protein
VWEDKWGGRLKHIQAADGKWAAEGINKSGGEFDFGQRKQPSP